MMFFFFACEHLRQFQAADELALIIRQIIREIEGCRPPNTSKIHAPACAHLKVNGYNINPVPSLAVSISTGATKKYHAGF